jgi:hypothetical protein
VRLVSDQFKGDDNMAAKQFGVAILLSTLAGVGRSDAQLTLPERARASNGRTEAVMFMEFDTATIPELVKRADVIVYGKISSVGSTLSADEMTVVTAYTIDPIRLLKERVPVRTATRPQTTRVLTVTHPGGTVSDSRGVMTTIVDAYPANDRFSRGDEGLFFLIAKGDTFAFVHGPSGAFHINHGTLQAMTKEIAERRGDEPRQLSDVIRDVESMVHKQ